MAVPWSGQYGQASVLTAHLPSGYILSRAVGPGISAKVPAALTGAVLPDLDLLFFYFVDERSIHHHRYWVHVPVFWLCIAALALPVLARFGWLSTGLVFFAAIFLHLLLDSIGGGILWAAPFDDRLYSLVTVPPTQDHWVASFVLHWTFLLELAVWAGAIFLWQRSHFS